MEGGCGNSLAGPNTRWNPTKEQISILEGLYGQGVRTPTAEQIQCITSRLKEYGHIEGKNVFYWFQNHKARQRQKEKQQHSFSSYVNRCYFPTAPAPGLFHPPCPTSPNVLYGPYYVAQQCEMQDGYNYAPYPKVLLPSGLKRRQRVAENNPLDRTKASPFCYPLHPHGNRRVAATMMHTGTNNCCDSENFAAIRKSETLDLFPVHPTGAEREGKMVSSPKEDYLALFGSSDAEKDGRQDQPFFDFFSSNYCCGQD